MRAAVVEGEISFHGLTSGGNSSVAMQIDEISGLGSNVFVAKAEFEAHDPSALKSRYRILALNHLNLFSFSTLR